MADDDVGDDVVDARPDPEIDGGPDKGPDAGPDAAPDAALDAGPDAAPDPVLPALGPGAATLSGAPSAGMVDGARGVARFANPVNAVADGSGGLYVCDFDNGRIRHVAADGTTTTPAASPATFARPFGLARVGEVLFIQTDRSTTGAATGALWKLTLGTGTFTLVRDGFGRYRGLAALSDGRLVAADYQRHVVSLIDPATGLASPLAGTALATGYVDSSGAAARFNAPIDVVVLPGDVILVADAGNHVVRKVQLDGTVTTFAGSGAAGTANGPRLEATFLEPVALARDPAGNVYVGDPGAGTVRRISSIGDVTTFAGTGTAGYADDPDPRAAQFYGLEGLDASADGLWLYVADGTRGEDLPYHRVRRVSLAP